MRNGQEGGEGSKQAGGGQGKQTHLERKRCWELLPDTSCWCLQTEAATRNVEVRQRTYLAFQKALQN